MDAGELETTNAMLRSVIDGIADPAYAKDADGRYLLVNRAAERAAGLRADQVLDATDEKHAQASAGGCSAGSTTSRRRSGAGSPSGCTPGRCRAWHPRVQAGQGDPGRQRENGVESAFGRRCIDADRRSRSAS
jgi:PAS domain-containing protein